MRRFYVYSPSWTEEHRTLWSDCGFIPVSELTQCGSEPPDIYLTYGLPEQPTEFWQSAKTLRSKIVVIAAKSDQPVPPSAQDVYEKQYMQGDILHFTLATRLEGEIPSPLWDMHRAASPLTESLETKIIADTLYRYLLSDVLRETFEWCGHTFSVLGPA